MKYTHSINRNFAEKGYKFTGKLYDLILYGMIILLVEFSLLVAFLYSSLLPFIW